MDFTIILPSGQTTKITLIQKELKGRFLLNKIFEQLKIIGEAKLYFGLRYSEKGDETITWISPEDNLKSLSFLSSLSKRHPSMQFAVRTFPKNPELVFSNTESRMLFRQHIKNMMLDNELGCDSKSHAQLDACIAQSELGDYSEENKDYIKKLNKLNIYAPSILGAGTPLGESEYMKMVRSYHKKLSGVRPTQADVLFLTQVQKLPLYGYKIYNVSEKSADKLFIALSEEGINFIYDSYLEAFSKPKRKETFAWGDLIYSELIRNKVKMGFLVKGEEFVEKNIKVAGNYSVKAGSRFIDDLSQHKNIFLSVVDGGSVFKSRKKAQRAYSAKIPRKSSLNKRVIHSLRSSLRWNKKVRSNDEGNNFDSMRFETQHQRRLHSE